MPNPTDLLIIQIDPRERVNFSDPGRSGVLHPVNADGFYSADGGAEEVAGVMAAVHPKLDTYLVRVVKKIE